MGSEEARLCCYFFFFFFLSGIKNQNQLTAAIFQLIKKLDLKHSKVVIYWFLIPLHIITPLYELNEFGWLDWDNKSEFQSVGRM